MKRFRNILFVTDPATDHGAALARATELAATNSASLTLMSIIAEDFWRSRKTSESLRDLIVTGEQDRLNRIAEDTSSTSGVSVETVVQGGKAFIGIIRQVLRSHHDLVIKAPAASVGFSQALFASLDRHLMRKCPSPVWIVNSTVPMKYRRILAAVDQDPDDAPATDLNQKILELSSSLALMESSELHIVHAWKLFAESMYRSRLSYSDAEVDVMVEEEELARRRWLEDLVTAHYPATGGREEAVERSKRIHLIKGDAREVVPQIAGELEVDLIVMGTVGRVGIPGFFMGNTSEDILESVRCSVLAIKPSGFISPVSLE